MDLNRIMVLYAIHTPYKGGQVSLADFQTKKSFHGISNTPSSSNLDLTIPDHERRNQGSTVNIHQ